jgi:tRNA dimethylallyltransferase
MIPIIVVVGPTAAGKSGVAEELAKKYNGVIVNADARQIYKDIRILSAAPEEQKNTRLYEFKLVNESYSFAEFVVHADQAIAEIAAEGKVPIVVGGTGLYIDALVQRFVPPPVVAPEIRARVAEYSQQEIIDLLKTSDPHVLNTIDVQNPRRVQRALEVVLQTGQSITSFGQDIGNSPYIPLLIGWSPDREELHERIAKRVQQMWIAGAVLEVKQLLAAGHTSGEPGMQAIGVSEIEAYLSGQLTEVEAQQKMIERTRQYARRQLTWFRRNKNIVWYTSFDDIWHSVHTFLQTNSNRF